MMKKIKTLLVTFCVFMMSLTPVLAYNNHMYYESDDFEIETIITIENSTRASGTITAKKSNNYKKDGKTMFTVSVTGTFTYDGSHSTCTNATASASSKNANWKISSKNASKSGNCAMATATAKRYYDGSVVETKTCAVALSCDANGNLY